MLLRSLLRVVQDGNASNGRKRQQEGQMNGKEKETGEALLKSIRLLTEMAPEERTVLIKLIKAIG